MVIMMNNYEQHIKHWKNHRKDRYTQQCSGYFGDGPSQIKEDELEKKEAESFRNLLKKAKSAAFPIWIAQSGGWFWFICDEKNMFGNKICNYEDLKRFGEQFVFNENDYS